MMAGGCIENRPLQITNLPADIFVFDVRVKAGYYYQKDVDEGVL